MDMRELIDYIEACDIILKEAREVNQYLAKGGEFPDTIDPIKGRDAVAKTISEHADLRRNAIKALKSNPRFVEISNQLNNPMTQEPLDKPIIR